MPLITGPQRARSKINWARAVLEPAIALAGVPEKETGPVAALELAIGLAVVPELETAPVVALALDQVVVALRIRLVTAAHPHDLVPAPRVEDSAAVAETTREPAAAEAVIAWAAEE